MSNATIIDECLNKITCALLQFDVQFKLVRDMQTNIKKIVNLNDQSPATTRARSSNKYFFFFFLFYVFLLFVIIMMKSIGIGFHEFIVQIKFRNNSLCVCSLGSSIEFYWE